MKRIIQGLVLATLISTAQASPFPADGEPVNLPAQWTYADRHAGEGNVQLSSAIPGNGEQVNLPAQSTYADAHAGEGNMQLGSAFPADGEPVNLSAQSTYADRFATDRSSTIEASAR
jgi:sulfur carrier protein ThiS